MHPCMPDQSIMTQCDSLMLSCPCLVNMLRFQRVQLSQKTETTTKRADKDPSGKANLLLRQITLKMHFSMGHA